MIWIVINNGMVIFNFIKGMYVMCDFVIVCLFEGDRFFFIVIDFNVDGKEYGWLNWDWVQSGVSCYIEVWEFDDLYNWFEQ